MPKILIVDDDRDILTVASMLLKMNGFDVAMVDNGRQVIEKVSETHPDLILLDVNLGDADGRDLCKELKKKGETSHIPIVLFSANHNIDQSYSTCGANGFIAKPFETLEFIQTLRNHIKIAS